MIENQNGLLDGNLYEVIIDCSVKRISSKIAQINVMYENGQRERIWTFNPTRYSFDYLNFIGMNKIEAVFYCDRKRPDEHV